MGGTLTFFFETFKQVIMSSESKAEVIDVDVGKKKAKAPKGLVKRLSATKAPKTGDELKAEQDKAAAKRAEAEIKMKKVDLEGAAKRAATDQAKADKAKADKEAAEQTSKQIPNE